MNKLTHSDLLTLEAYSRERAGFRAKVIAHKGNRKVHLGEHATLYFEDRLTMQYQIQEMLRIERIFEAAAIDEELQAYNPLIPDGCNWKATFMIEYNDAEERRVALGQMLGIEDAVWVQAEGCERVFAIADEDIERERADKTSAVHFMRFELTGAMSSALKSGASLEMGVALDGYSHSTGPLNDAVRAALVADLA